MKIIFTSFEKAKLSMAFPKVLFPGSMIMIDKPEDTDAGCRLSP